MSNTIKPTKTFQETLKYLGKDFSSKVIDGELCGYFKINDCYDIEISGMNNNRVKNLNFTIYVWNIKNGMYIKEQKTVHSLSELKRSLDSLIEHYSNEPDQQ